MSTMRWFFSLLRMIFKKPSKNKDPLAICKNDDDVAEEPTVVEPFDFDKLPIDMVLKIWSELPYTDAVSLRQCNTQTFSVYNDFRGQIKGAEIILNVDIEGENIVTRARLSNSKSDQGTVIPEEMRCWSFQNANVRLVIRLGENPMTAKISSALLEALAKAKLEYVHLIATTVSDEAKEFLNTLNCQRTRLDVAQYNENMLKVANVHNIEIKSELLFFEFNEIVSRASNLEYITVTVTAASLPRIMQCVEEWSQGRRKIMIWSFLIPMIQIIRNFRGLPIDWRRSIRRREDGTSRLLMYTRNVSGALVNYQNLIWRSL